LGFSLSRFGLAERNDEAFNQRLQRQNRLIIIAILKALSK
jgi:hypothetical protein